MIQGQFPLWLLFLLLGLFVSAIVFCSTSNDCPPRYHSVSACVCVCGLSVWRISMMMMMMMMITPFCNTVAKWDSGAVVGTYQFQAPLAPPSAPAC